MPNVHHVTRRNLNILATIQASKRNDRQLKFATPPPYFPYFFSYFFLLTPSAYLHLHTSFAKVRLLLHIQRIFLPLNVRRKWSILNGTKTATSFILCSKYVCFFSKKTSSNRNGEMMRKIDLKRSLFVY